MDGIVTYWYETGEKEYEGTYKDGKREGTWTEWYENGNKMEEINYTDDKSIGWYENGNKKFEGTPNIYEGKGILSKRSNSNSLCWDEDGDECECDRWGMGCEKDYKDYINSYLNLSIPDDN